MIGYHERTLADRLVQIGLQSLRGLAFENFRSGIDSTNITQELLSPFSAK